MFKPQPILLGISLRLEPASTEFKCAVAFDAPLLVNRELELTNKARYDSIQFGHGQGLTNAVSFA